MTKMPISFALIFALTATVSAQIGVTYDGTTSSRTIDGRVIPANRVGERTAPSGLGEKLRTGTENVRAGSPVRTSPDTESVGTSGMSAQQSSSTNLPPNTVISPDAHSGYLRYPATSASGTYSYDSAGITDENAADMPGVGPSGAQGTGRGWSGNAFGQQNALKRDTTLTTSGTTSPAPIERYIPSGRRSSSTPR